MFIHYVKKHPDAVTPSRTNHTDIGLDLVAIAKHKVYPNGATLYDTGIAVSPPPGYYIELVPRSSISKTGWILANSVGTIDPSYTGNLFIALIRVDPEAPEISLPFCACQIALRKALGFFGTFVAEYADVKEVEELAATERGDGGFGSTGERTC
jgi:dUTP pyrophosphatase